MESTAAGGSVLSPRAQDRLAADDEEVSPLDDLRRGPQEVGEMLTFHGTRATIPRRQ